MSGVDISREACEREVWRQSGYTAALILALRAALDAAERERDAAQAYAFRSQQIAREQAIEAHNAEDKCEQLVVERDAADATGYARGVRDAAAYHTAEAARLRVEHNRDPVSFPGSWVTHHESDAAAILALLPATNEKRLTRYMGQIMAECDCPRQDECQNAERCLAEKEKNDAE